MRTKRGRNFEQHRDPRGTLTEWKGNQFELRPRISPYISISKSSHCAKILPKWGPKGDKILSNIGTQKGPLLSEKVTNLNCVLEFHPSHCCSKECWYFLAGNKKERRKVLICCGFSKAVSQHLWKLATSLIFLQFFFQKSMCAPRGAVTDRFVHI